MVVDRQLWSCGWEGGHRTRLATCDLSLEPLDSLGFGADAIAITVRSGLG